MLIKKRKSATLLKILLKINKNIQKNCEIKSWLEWFQRDIDIVAEGQGFDSGAGYLGHGVGNGRLCDVSAS